MASIERTATPDLINIALEMLVNGPPGFGSSSTMKTPNSSTTNASSSQRTRDAPTHSDRVRTWSPLGTIRQMKSAPKRWTQGRQYWVQWSRTSRRWNSRLHPRMRLPFDAGSKSGTSLSPSARSTRLLYAEANRTEIDRIGNEGDEPSQYVNEFARANKMRKCVF